MSSFDFVSDDVLRRIIERDKKELDDALSSNLHKSTTLLAGSLIEAILVDYFLVFETSHAKDVILHASLGQLMDWALEEKLISQRTFEISNVIKNYRNLIHPGKEYRLSERIDEHSATVAKHLVEMIIQEIGENYSKKLGYKAEAVIAKITIDPSAVSIIKRIVEQMSTIERIKLFRMIPDVCKAEDMLPERIDDFLRLHVLLSENIPQDVIKGEAEKVKEFINHRSQQDILFHLRFYMRHLNKLMPQERKVIAEYLLALLASSSEDTLQLLRLIELKFLGEYIELDGQKDLLERAIMERFYGATEYYDVNFFRILENICIGLPHRFVIKLAKEFQEIDEEFDTEQAKKWAAAINDFIPF
jgi:hypothetical protein